MGTKTASAASLTGPFVAEAAARGVRPPTRLVDQGSRAWPVVDQDKQSLFVDEYGDLWWAKRVGTWDARTIRSCWPEEFTSMHDEIRRSIEQIIAG